MTNLACGTRLAAATALACFWGAACKEEKARPPAGAESAALLQRGVVKKVGEKTGTYDRTKCAG